MKTNKLINKELCHTCLIILSVLLLSACAANRQYHTLYEPCHTATPLVDCKASAIVDIRNPDDPDENYSLAFIEFDDQGQLHDRKQLMHLTDELYPKAAEDNLLIVVFVHGWQHNAQPDDSYLVNFHKTLRKLSKHEAKAARADKRKKRQIVGVYLGWRGLSLNIPFISTTTFWERKNTAHKVGRGGVAEVLSKLEELRNVKISIDETIPLSRTRLVIIGHSFGGAVVYTALSQILMDRFVQTKGPVGTSSDARGFGDLVVLINPAFEATDFLNLSLMANERGRYFATQLPVLAVMTSESDWATKYAFWAGRLVSTLFNTYKDISYINKATAAEQIISEGEANRTAIGHFTPIKTHYLKHKPEQKEESDMSVYQRVQAGWDADAPDTNIEFNDSILHHLNNSISHNPYLVIKVDKRIIPNHGDIFNDAVEDFIRNFILLSVQDN
tara:strand:+ start:1600 stop:2931 length:1332 start_codon:yes stop_codon:yes gene_type:complete